MPLARARRSRPVARRSPALSESLPSPTGGWNTRDNIAAMDQLDAVRCINFFPNTTDVELRSGFSVFASGLGSQVETVIAYSGGSTNKIFGIAGGSIYDATSGGAVGAASVSGLSNSRWQSVNFANSGGNYVLMVNGADGYYTFDGTSWTDNSASITGVTASQLIDINVFKFRVWFIQTGTLKAWYLPTNAIQGAATAFDLSGVAQRGGYLVAMGTWTIDAGTGIEDFAAWITSNGEVIVYQGTDPSSAATWALKGIWNLGSPVGRRCLVKWKGDLLIISQDGLIPLSGALQSSRVNPRVALTNKIQRSMSDAVSLYSSNFGWQVIAFPKQNQLYLNVPIQTNNQQQQYVMNTITGAWCSFTGWNANCWEIYNDSLYFGANGYIGKAWDTHADNGQAISGQVLQAFSNFGAPGRLKRFMNANPIITTSSRSVSVSCSMNTDFSLASATGTTQSTSSAGAWGTGKWGTAKWGLGQLSIRSYNSASGMGYYAAPNVAVMTTGINLKWVGTDVLYEVGGFIGAGTGN